MKKMIEYVYSAGGTKLKVTRKWNPNYSRTPVIGSAVVTGSLTQSKTTDYVGNLIYENGTLMKILYDGGYYEPSTNRYYYFVNDYQGNMRTVLYGDYGNIREKGQYYPFGSVMAQETSYEDVQPYKFSGKEEDHERGLNFYDFHARQYESALGRFTSMDPMAERYYSWSPYGYCLGNPVKYVDPTGMWSRDANGNLIAEDGDTQETLATFLNTNPGIALNIMLEQGFDINDDGNIVLRGGEGLKIKNDTYNANRRDLGFEGNLISMFAGSEFSKDLFENYWTGGGDVELSHQRFASILMYLKENNEKANDKKARVVDFYPSQEYALAFGRATVYFNSKGEAIGFHDTYDFDFKPQGKRTLKNELKTRAVNIMTSSSSKPFNITYGNK